MFSKSKRFRSPVTHAPAVGSYDVNAQTKNAGTMIFGKSKRFLQSKENIPGPCDTSVFLDLSTCSGSSFSSNIRSTPRCNSNNRDKINDLERTIDNLKEELNYLRENLQLTTERVQNQGLSSFSQETQTETIDTDSKLEEMKKELEKLKIVHKCDLENIKANCDLEIARNMAFKSRIEVLERSNQELCNDRDQVEDYNRRLQATKSDLTREHLELSEKLEKKDEELLALEEQLKHSISTAEKEIANRRTEFDAMITKLADMTKKLDIKDKDIVVMKEEVKLSEDKAKKEIESLKGLLDEEVIRRKAHEEKSTVCEENLKNALKTVDSLNRLKEELEKKSQQLEENIVILGQSNQDLSTNHEEEKKQSQELIRRLQREKMELSNKLDLKIVKIKAHEEKYAECIKHYEENISNLTKTAQDLRTTNSDLERKVHDLEEIIHEFSLKEHDGDSLKINDEEIQKWKMKYEELQEKVEPFKEQLDAFEAEKNFLLSKHSEVQNEVSTLSAQYAKLLGHQNQKQKIHHVLKLKQENIDLKSELFKLREQCEKQKRSIKQQGKVSTVKKKFSPEDAFAPARK